MTPEEVLKQLEKHEASCDKRYEAIQTHLVRLDNRLWAIVILIVVAAGLEHLI